MFGMGLCAGFLVGYAHKSGPLIKPPYRGAAQYWFQRNAVKNSAR
jgi:hypothetical protein